MKYYLYILKSLTEQKYYIGTSKDAENRLKFHNTLEKGFTSRYRPWEMVFKQEFKDKKLALGSEKKLKSWKSKKMIEKVISGKVKI